MTTTVIKFRMLVWPWRDCLLPLTLHSSLLSHHILLPRRYYSPLLDVSYKRSNKWWFTIGFFFLKNYVYECLAYVWVLCVCLVPKEVRTESCILGTGVSNGYEPPCKCGGWTGILCKRNQCFRPLNHLSSPPWASLLCTFRIASISFHCWKKIK